MSKLTLSDITDALEVYLERVEYEYIQGLEENLNRSLLSSLLKNCKFPLQFIADGAFREAYRIVDTTYVLKIPSSGTDGDIIHAKADINAYDLIQKTPKMKSLRKYLPTQYWTSSAIGVILTDFVRPLAKDYNSGRQKTYFGRYRQEVIKVAALVKKHGDAYDGDLDLQKLDNFGSVNGQLKILDLGCFTGESC